MIAVGFGEVATAVNNAAVHRRGRTAGSGILNGQRASMPAQV
jgi:hypothetical protein